MSNIVIKPARSGGDPLIEFTGSAGGESRIQIESDGKISFVGGTKFSTGISGSLQTLTGGEPYLMAGTGITISTGSSPAGQITIASTITQVVPSSPSNSVQYNNGGAFGGDNTFTFDGSTDTLSVQNVVVAGDLTVNGSMLTVNTTNLEVKDAVVGLGFSSGTIAETAGDRGLIGGIAGADNVAILWKNTAAEFAIGRTTSSATGSFGVSSYSNLHVADIQANIVTASLGFSGSLTKLADGSDYLRAGSNITLTTGALGQVTVAASGFAPLNATYLTTVNEPSISNERVFTPRTGLVGTESSESWLKYYLDINNDVVATISGSTFTGAVKFNGGLSGSLQRLVGGEAYLNAGAGITISTGSSPVGQITIASTITQVSPGSPTNSVQYNGAGAFTGDSDFTFDGSSLYLTGAFSHGSNSFAVGQYSLAAGLYTIASGSSQVVVGKYNKRNNTDSIFVVGNGDGDSNSNRSDVFLINTGSVLIGSASIASDTFLYVGTKGDATNSRFDGNVVVSGTLDVKNGAASSVLSVNGSRVGVNTSSPSYTLEVNGDFAAVTKSFVIDHPSKPGWKLRHGSLEGPENGVYVRGRTNLSEITLPEYWADLVDEDSISVQITPVRSKLTYFVSYIGVDKICVEFDSQNVEYCYLVQASRKDETFEVEFPAS